MRMSIDTCMSAWAYDWIRNSVLDERLLGVSPLERMFERSWPRVILLLPCHSLRRRLARFVEAREILVRVGVVRVLLVEPVPEGTLHVVRVRVGAVELVLRCSDLWEDCYCMLSPRSHTGSDLRTRKTLSFRFDKTIAKCIVFVNNGNDVIIIFPDLAMYCTCTFTVELTMIIHNRNIRWKCNIHDCTCTCSCMHTDSHKTTVFFYKLKWWTYMYCTCRSTCTCTCTYSISICFGCSASR